jgi:hypothetical protein
VNGLYTEPYGGAINAYPFEKNAFIHRNVYMNLVIDAFWNTKAEKKATEHWLSEFDSLRRLYFGEQAYQNYPRRSYGDYRRLYWQSAFDSLLRIKNKYDPNNVFRYQQSISP